MTPDSTHGLIFIHLDEINCFLQHDHDHDHGASFLTETILKITGLHNSLARLFLKATYSATMSAKLIQVVVQSQDAQIIIDLENLTASNYVDCLSHFLAYRFKDTEGSLFKILVYNQQRNIDK